MLRDSIRSIREGEATPPDSNLVGQTFVEMKGDVRWFHCRPVVLLNGSGFVRSPGFSSREVSVPDMIYA